MQDWEEVRKKYPNWEHPLWQWVFGGICVRCGIKGEETVQGYLRIVEGEGDTRYCGMCYFSKFVNDEDDEDDWEDEEFDVNDLPPEVMTDGRGNKTLDNY